MDVTNENRIEFLKAYNDLRHILMSIHECQDIWMSDIGKLESIHLLMQRVLKFVPQHDDQGNRMHYSDWVRAELDEDDA